MNPTAPPAEEDDDLIVRAFPQLVEGFGALLTSVGAALTVLHFTVGMGFPSASQRAAVFTMVLGPPLNTLSQYAVALATIFAVGALDVRFLARRMGPVARRLDLLAAAALLFVAWWTPQAGVALAAFAGRAAIAAWLVWGPGRARVEASRQAARLATWAFAASLAMSVDLLSLVLPSNVNAAVANAPPWLLFLLAAPVVLYVAEEMSSPQALAWQRRVSIFLVLVAIPLITFRVSAAYFDASVIVGPVNDLMLGKDMPDGVIATYGFLFSYFLAAVFRLFRVSDLYLGLSVINSLAFIACYMTIFGLVLVRLRRMSLVVAAMTSIVAVHYFHLHVPIAWLPQAGFLRFGAIFPVFLLLYALDERPQSRRLEWIFAVSVAVALLWTIEVGGYIAFGLVGAFGRELLFRQPGDRTVFRRMAKVAAAVVGVLGLAVLRVLVRHGHAPAFADLVHFQRAYSSGLAMAPIKTFERWPVPILVYLVTVLATLSARRMRHGTSWIFLALFGLGAMAYPLGKTGIFELSRVALPALLLVVSFVGFVEQNGARLKIAVQGSSFRLAPVAAGGFLCLSAGLACLVYADSAVPLETSLAFAKDHRKPIADSSPSWETFVRTPANREAFARDLDVIAALVPPEDGLPILSKNDTLYYVFAHRKAIYKNSFYPHFFFKADIDRMVAALLSSTVAYMFLDNSGFQAYENGIDMTPANAVWARVAPHYRFVRHAGLLDVYERLSAAQ